MAQSVIAIDINTGEGVIYKTVKEAHDITGVAISSITRCCNGERKRGGAYSWDWYNGTETNFDVMLKNKVKTILIESGVVDEKA